MGNFEEIGLDRGAGGVVAGAWRPPGIAVCNISDAKLDEAVIKSPQLRTPKNRYLVRDLRTLTDAAAMELVHRPNRMLQAEGLHPIG